MVSGENGHSEETSTLGGVAAERVELSQSAVGDVTGAEVNVRQAFVRSVSGGEVEIEESMALSARAQRIEVEESVVGLAVAQDARIDRSSVVFLLSPRVSGNVNAVFTLPAAFAFGFGIVVARRLTGWLRRR